MRDALRLGEVALEPPGTGAAHLPVLDETTLAEM
jgi:hypothetical protein